MPLNKNEGIKHADSYNSTFHIFLQSVGKYFRNSTSIWYEALSNADMMFVKGQRNKEKTKFSLPNGEKDPL